MTARTVMIQGTGSSVGKSLIATGLCRLFRRAGLTVAPFKAQNMALNSAVADGGGEIGRAQAVQAEAAEIAPSVEINPILLKPEGNTCSQVVVLGRPVGSMSACEYHARKQELTGVIADALEKLRDRVDLVVIEGAGSPAEVNLKDRDIVNMHVAHLADAPVLLVGDIDRGGVFASLVGTMELLDAEERVRVAALVVNKFRGDRRLLEPGLEFLERRTGVPLLGVLPHLPNLRIADEDSVSLDERRERQAGPGELEIAVVRLPHISNWDDFESLEHEAGVAVRYATSPDELARADLAVLPGSKCTARDLAWLRESGMAASIAARGAQARPVLGVCGGCQMLGQQLFDPERIEFSSQRVEGLGLLPLRTRFLRDKTTAQICARLATTSLFGKRDAPVSGYEIHMGLVEQLPAAVPSLQILSRNGVPCREPDGAVAAGGAVTGTMVHGLFESEQVRSALLDWLRSSRGLCRPDAPAVPTRDAEYDRLARSLLCHLDWRLLCQILGLALAPPLLGDLAGS